MESRSVSNIRLSKDDMRRVYRNQVRQRRGGVKWKHIIEVLDIIVPIIPDFFKNSQVHANNDMSYKSSGLCGLGMSSDDDAFVGRHGRHSLGGMDCGVYLDSNGCARSNGHHKIAHADDFGDRIISEEEFERLLDYAEQRNVKMY